EVGEHGLDLHPAVLRFGKRKTIGDGRRRLKRRRAPKDGETNQRALHHPRDASTGPVSIGSRCRQMMSAITRAPAAFGCARSGCISCGFPMMLLRMNGTSGT